MNETRLEPYSSLFHPDWRESGAQFTGKQAVLLMHDTYLVKTKQQAVMGSLIILHVRHNGND